MARRFRGWAVVVAVLLAPAVAHAEGGVPGCHPTTIIGADGPLPRNLPGLPFRPSWLGSQPSFILIDDLGTEVSTTVATATAWRFDSSPPPNPVPLSFIALATPPPAGHYVLNYEETCGLDERPMVNPAAVKVSIDLGPEQPLPTSLGTVKVTAQPTIFKGQPSATGCVVSDAGQILTLEWIRSPELTPFLPVTFTMIYWNRDKGPGSYESATSVNTTTVLQICNPARGAYSYGLLDRYTSVTLRGYVAGMDHELDPLRVAIDLPCAPPLPAPEFTGDCDSGTAVIQPDTSISDGGTHAVVNGDASQDSAPATATSETDDGTTLPTATPGSAPPDPRSPEHGGCATASVPRRNQWSSTAMLMFGLGMAIRRARSSLRRRPGLGPRNS
jgi:hypothetical protein